jgi:hypothetical protein
MNSEVENCQLLFQNETLLYGALQDRPSKTAAIVFSIILTLTDALLLYGVIWFQNFGPDHGRTLVNRIFTSFCWTCMVALFIGATDVIRYITGPFPKIVCHIIVIFKNMVRTEILLFYDLMAISRYILIFHRNNPTALDEQFWNQFIYLTITIASLIINFVYQMLPTKKDSFYYICCGQDPDQDSELPRKREGLFLLLSFILQLFINTRIMILKHNDKLKRALQFFQLSSCKLMKLEENSFKMSFDKNTIINTSAICWGLIFFFAFYKFNALVKSFSFEELNEYPNYLYLYVLQLIFFQSFGLFMLIILYVRHDKLYNTLYRNFTE